MDAAPKAPEETWRAIPGAGSATTTVASRRGPCLPSADRRSVRVAVVVSHPIQHFCPQYGSWARLPGITLRVFFASRAGLDAYFDRDFAAPIRWEGLALDFPHEFLSGAENRTVTAALDAPAVGERLAAFRPDVLCLYGYSQRLARRTATWAQLAGVPVLMITDSELRSPRSWMKRAVKALVVPRLLRRADRFLTVGDANEAYLRRYGAPAESFVRSGFPIDVAAYDRVMDSAARARAAIRGQYGIPNHHLVLLMVGKLTKQKRQRDLVEFSNHIRRLRDDVTVVLAGSGPEEPALRRLAATSGPGGVVFAGFVQPRDLPAHHAAADAYVHCSEMDPHPLAVSEAVYTGLPVVVSDRCGNHGPTDEVRPGVNGCVFPCGDADALAAALDRLLASPERRAAMGRESRRLGRGIQRLAHGEALLRALDSLGLPASRGAAGEGPVGDRP